MGPESAIGIEHLIGALFGVGVLGGGQLGWQKLRRGGGDDGDTYNHDRLEARLDKIEAEMDERVDQLHTRVNDLRHDVQAYHTDMSKEMGVLQGMIMAMRGSGDWKPGRG